MEGGKTMASHVIVALFDDYGDAQRAIGELETAGIRADDINIVANNAGNRYGTHPEHRFGDAPAAAPTTGGETAGAGAAIGALLAGGAGLLAGIGALAIPGIGPVVAAGALVSTLAGAGVGAAAGGLIGALAGAGISREHADLYAEAVRRGGTLLTVRADDASQARVSDILERHNPVDVEERATGWRDEGWTGFDAAAAPYAGASYPRPAGSSSGVEPTTMSGARADHPVSAGQLPESSEPTPMPTGSGTLDTRPDWDGRGEPGAPPPIGGPGLRSRVRAYPVE
ncbi:MAG: hypothetical protein JO305_01620 [Alphaproteobacteria bacterium]|nr:hypothetical protein [Alphaproteobacteria bacterium]